MPCVSDRTGPALAELHMPRVPGLLGPLFEEAGRGDRQAREALFLTFNVDLGFFESRLLGPVRSAGAAVTVVADSSVFDPDARSVRAAGYGYALGLAAMNGAVHPKLTVLAGAQRAVIGIGSGNLTVSGWHANDEVLTTILADRDEGVPLLTRDVAEFLDRLRSVVPISALGRDGIARTVAQLVTLCDAGAPVDTGHQLVHSLDRPIIEQLPDQHADVLELSAPFHDLTGRALHALLTRFQPQQVEVLAQTGQAVMDPEVLQRSADRRGVTLRFVEPSHERSAPDPYRHGKLITALVGGEPRWSLVGSPNLSAAALLGTAPLSNCEIAVLSSTARSLFPVPTALVTDTVTLRHTIIQDPADDDQLDEAHGVRLLEARAVDAGVEITVSAPAHADLLVDYSLSEWPPERFDTLGTLVAGTASAEFPRILPPRTRIRLGVQIQFLAFPDAIVSRLRPAGAEHVNHNALPADLFASETIAAEWSGALTRLLLTHGRQPTPTVASGSTHYEHTEAVSDWRTLDDPDAWAEYSEGALNRLGLPIFQLASGDTASPKVVGAALPNASPAWEDQFDDTGDAYEEDQSAETVDASEDEPPPAPVNLAPARRTRLRTWVGSVAQLAPKLPPLECIAIAQLVTAGTSALIWNADTGPEGWFTPLATALEGLSRKHWPAAARSQAAAVAAVGLYRLRMAVPGNERGAEALTFGRVAETLGPLLSDATLDGIAANLALLHGATIHPRTAQEILQELERALESSPAAVIQRVLERLLPDFEIVWLGPNLLTLTGPTSNPLAIAGAALPHADRIPHLAITVTSLLGRTATVIRIPDRLTVVEAANGRLLFKTYRTTGLLAATGLLTNAEMAQTRRLSVAPFFVPGEVDLEVLEAVGLLPDDLRR